MLVRRHGKKAQANVRAMARQQLPYAGNSAGNSALSVAAVANCLL